MAAAIPERQFQSAGNCDERGTEEYNLALGQRRANGDRDYLVAQGVAPNADRNDQLRQVASGRPRFLPAGLGTEPQCHHLGEVARLFHWPASAALAHVSMAQSTIDAEPTSRLVQAVNARSSRLSTARSAAEMRGPNPIRLDAASATARARPRISACNAARSRSSSTDDSALV